MEQEGVTKFRLDWNPGPAPERKIVDEIGGWRDRLVAIGGVGADPLRYGGIGFGNLSRRVPAGFWITATQTGELAHLDASHYALVCGWEIDRNHILAGGPARPSSESMTHAAVYAARREAQYVFHAHLPELWHHAGILGIPSTPAGAEYGTPGMAHAVGDIAAAASLPCTIRMAGHEDGMIAIGRSARETGEALLVAVARSARTGETLQPSRALRR